MKVQTLATVLVGLVAACGGAADEQAPLQALPPPAASGGSDVSPPVAATEDAGPPAPKPTLAELEAAALKTMAESASDPGKRASLYASDASFWVAGSPGCKGRQAIRQALQDFLDTTTGDLKSANVRSWTRGSVVALEFVTTATDKATGKPWGVDGLVIYTFNDDGFITTDHTYLDLLTIKKQTGAFRDKSPARPVATLPTAPIETHVSKGDATEETNVASEKGLMGARGKLDAKAVLGYYAPGASVEDWSDDRTHTFAEAKPGIVALIKRLKDAKWTDWNDFGVEDFTIDDGELVSMRADKKVVTSHAAEVDQWKDGKVVKSWSWSNGLEVARELGVGPFAKAPGAPPPKKSAPPTPPAK